MKLLGKSLVLSDLAFVRWNLRVAFALNLILCHSWGKTLLNTQPLVPWISMFSTLANGDKNYSWFCVSSENCSSKPFRWFFPQPWAFSHVPALVHFQLKSLWRSYRDLQNSLFTQLPPLNYSLLWTLAPLSLLHYKICVLNSRSLWTPSGLSLPAVQVGDNI